MTFVNYLNFRGDCREAFERYLQVFGGEIDGIMTHADMPVADIPDEWRDKVLHAQLNVNGSLLMGSDSPPNEYREPGGAWVCLLVDTPEEADRIFAELSDGGEVEMPIEETAWAERFGMLRDRFGVPWMINCLKPM